MQGSGRGVQGRSRIVRGTVAGGRLELVELALDRTHLFVLLAVWCSIAR